MPVLSPGQIARVMLACGWGPPGGLGIQVFDDGTQKVVDQGKRAAAIAWYDTAIAVCLAESNGDTNAKNPSSNARGLWQVMTSVHADMIKQVQAYWVDELDLKNIPTIFHPLVNTECAHRLYNGRKWQPWEAYNTGAYKSKLGHGAKAYASVIDPSFNAGNIAKLVNEIKLGQETGEVIGGMLAGGVLLNNDLVTDPMSGIMQLIKDAGPVIGWFVLGLVLLILGAWFLLSKTSVGKTVKKMTPLP